MAILDDIAHSREYEMRTYLRSMKAMYENAVAQNGEVYDIAFSLTNGFSRIGEDAIIEDSRVIKVLRYAVAPTISQMKFGQLFGLNSIGTFENERVPQSGPKHDQLKAIANHIARFATDNLDNSRFVWLANSDLHVELAYSYAKKWTCSIAADQNAQTAYRNWRKDLQEHAIVDKLISCGYIRSGFTGVVKKATDIKLGEYTQEIRVKGRTVQKADIVFRSRKSKKLVLVEAKAVGVEIDATKRIKECCDKSNDWSSSLDLRSPVVVAVIAGFFTPSNISNLEASRVLVVWEHRLNDLRKVT
jgi:hypothetical protein